MLENEKYRENSVATAPTMSDAPKDLSRCRYMLSMHQEGIISSEQFEDVQKESIAAISNSSRIVRISRMCNTGQDCCTGETEYWHSRHSAIR